MRSTKDQAPNRNELPSSNHQLRPRKFWNLVLGTSLVLGAWSLVLLLGACRRDMYDQPKAKPFSENSFFKDGASARQIPEHTVAHGDVQEDPAFSTGLTNGFLVAKLPVPLTPDLLSRGRERYDIYCAVCHGRTGGGNGEIVRRGFPAPPSFHIERLRNAPIGHFFDAITNGYGVMYSYASRVELDDRWAIAAYLRALQLSHNAASADVPPNEQGKLLRQ
jgi:mono/diheme cytochrome c family protein